MKGEERCGCLVTGAVFDIDRAEQASVHHPTSVTNGFSDAGNNYSLFLILMQVV